MGINIEHLRKIVENGPPPEPSAENPGPLLQTYLDEVARWKHDNDSMTLSPAHAGALLAHVIDRLNWGSSMRQFEGCKAMLEGAERRIVVPK